MNAVALRAAAERAEAAHPGRPAVSIVHDADDARVVLFRIMARQEVALHRSPSTVLLTVIDGAGLILGADESRPVFAGDMVAFEPNELHGMRATESTFIVMATIAPRPGSR